MCDSVSRQRTFLLIWNLVLSKQDQIQKHLLKIKATYTMTTLIRVQTTLTIEYQFT